MTNEEFQAKVRRIAREVLRDPNEPWSNILDSTDPHHIPALVELLVKLRAALGEGDSLADDERRMATLRFLFDGICLSCGRVVGDRICHCENDE